MVEFGGEDKRREYQKWAAQAFSELQGVKDGVVICFVVALPDGRLAVAHGGEDVVPVLREVMEKWVDGGGVQHTVQKIVPPA